MRSIRVLCLALTFALASVAAIPGPASVLAKCDPSRTDDGSSYWDGWYRQVATTGVGSDISNYDPWVHYSDDVVLAWTMLNNGSLYAQIGWIEYPFGFRYMFTEYTTSDHVYHRKLYTAQPVDSVHRYTTLFGSGVFTFQLDGVTGSTAPAQFTPNEGEVYGETHSLDDQMPGGYNKHETFRNTYILHYGVWYGFAGSLQVTTGTAYLSTGGRYALDIWDGACST